MPRKLFLRMWIALLLGTTVFPSCVKDDAGMGDEPADGTEIMFSIKLPGVKNPSSRTLDPDDEEKVETADVYVFDRATQKLVDIGYGRSITPDDSDPTKIIHNFSVTLQKAENRDVTVVTNARGIINSAFTGGVPLGTSKDDFRDKVIMELPAGGWNADAGSAGYASIPMWGERLNINIDGSTVLTGVNSVKITRMTARMNVAVAKNLVDAGKFKLSNVRVYNYNRYGLLVPDDAAAEGTWQDATPYAETPSLPQSPAWTKGPIVYGGSKVVDDRFIKNEIYLFEAEKGIAPADGNWLTNPCIVIGGSYEGGPETYYRVDIVKKENNTAEYLHILRNNSYNITITDVKGPGKGGPDEAYNTLPVNIDAEVVAWNDHDMNDHLSDGQYQLTVDKNLLTFYDEGREQPLKVFTDYPYGWKIEIDPQYPFLTGKITPTADNSGNSVDVKVKPGNILAINPAVPARDTLRYHFWITAGSMRKQIFVQHINEPELTIEIEPEYLIFRKAAAQPKSFKVTTYPAGIPITFSQVAGDIVWRPAGFPANDPVGTGTYQFHPDVNNSNPAKQRNSSVAVTVSSGQKIVTKIIEVIQWATDLVFSYTPNSGSFDPVAANRTITVTSDTDWFVTGMDGTTAMFASQPSYGTNQPGVTNYVVNLDGNNTWQTRSARLLVGSNDPDFPGEYITVSQAAKTPVLTINQSDTKDITNADVTATVTSNAKWSYSTDSYFANTATATASNSSTDSPLSNVNKGSVTFKAKAWKAESGTPTQGTTYQSKVTFTTAAAGLPSGVNQATASFSVKSTVPGFWTAGNGGVSPNTAFRPATNINISSAVSTTVTVYANTNAKWTLTPTVSANPQINAVSQNANSWQANRTQTITITPYNNGWGNRTVTINATNDANTSSASATYNQRGYYVNSTGHTAPALTNLGPGGNVKLGVNGWYPASRVKVRIANANNSNANSAISNEAIITTATGSFTTATGVIKTDTGTATVTIENNTTGSARNVYYQYSTSTNGSTWSNWTTFATISQPKGSVVLSTGRVAASADMSGLAWDVAMGIGSQYRTSLYYYINGGDVTNRYYTPTTTSGCAGYSEGGYAAGSWRLPTEAEVHEMILKAELGLTSDNYWTSTESASLVNSAVSVYKSGTQAKSQTSSKSNSWYKSRCVRNP